MLILNDTTLFDTSFLAGKFAQIVKFCTTNFTVFVDYDRVDKRRFNREDTLHTDVVAHLAHGETFFVTFARDADYNAAILLENASSAILIKSIVV